MIVEELVRSGSDAFFIAPGSRSSPLVAAVARNPRTHSKVHFDERGTAFAALGYARATRNPGVWVTTSGTALANGMPAVVEAALDGVPIILLTADRPPELRGTGANQTIDQPGLFGGYVRWFFDMPTPSDDIDPCFVLTTIDQAVHRSKTGRGGPVHLNCMFRDPLAPESQSHAPQTSSALELWKLSKAPFTRYSDQESELPAIDRGRLSRSLSKATRPLCILGRLPHEDLSRSVVAWANENSVPILPDITSQSIVAYYDLLLGSDSFRKSVRPDAILQIGRSPTSKRLAALVSDACPDPYILIATGPDRVDPDHRVTHRIDLTASGIDGLFSGTDFKFDLEPAWMDTWTRADALAGAWMDDRFGTGSDSDLSEQGVAYRLSLAIPEASVLVLGSSMPVRHADTFASIHGAFVRLVSNRGASGIDGTLATAAGYSAGARARTTVFLGDLALLHDLNSLALADKENLIVVVINNDGGGIFSYLPITTPADVFERYFGTPHGYTFENAAQMFGLHYANPDNHGDFDRAYDAALGKERASLIEIRTDRKSNHDLHLKLQAEFNKVLDA